jgi:hypothetical protein
MITFHTSADVTADRRVTVTLPPETPIGKAELTVTVAPQDGTAARGELRGLFGSLRSGNSRSADNDQIDADLERAYGNFNE